MQLLSSMMRDDSSLVGGCAADWQRIRLSCGLVCLFGLLFAPSNQENKQTLRQFLFVPFRDVFERMSVKVRHGFGHCASRSAREPR